MEGMFLDSGIESLDLDNFDTKKFQTKYVWILSIIKIFKY